jgi:phosphoribosylaminoimidazole-succinocarboxamide synthase
MNTLVKTNLPLKIVNKGKVRDIYHVNDKSLLLIATDRISAFDYVLPDAIPSKGACLTQLSRFWFDFTKDIVPNHIISCKFEDFPRELQEYRELEYRSMLVKKTRVIPIECIVRGYISGSAWNSYKKEGMVCGIKLPKGLVESEKLDDPLFTPSTKSSSGHDLNITFEKMKELIGEKVSRQLREFSLDIYEKAREYALKKNIIIADTKFEFGWLDDTIILIDELLTPDSSRFWPADEYEPGRSQPSFDKQFVRDYLNSIGWDKNSKPPNLPKEVIDMTSKKYREAYERLTGERFIFD